MKNILDYEIFNFLNEKRMEKNELEEMISITYHGSGIKDIVLWIGPNSKYKYKIIKVGNIAKDFKGTDCFILTIPDFKIIGNINKNLITDDILNQIKLFINKNMNNINLLYNNQIHAGEFIRKLIY